MHHSKAKCLFVFRSLTERAKNRLDSCKSCNTMSRKKWCKWVDFCRGYKTTMSLLRIRYSEIGFIGNWNVSTMISWDEIRDVQLTYLKNIGKKWNKHPYSPTSITECHIFFFLGGQFSPCKKGGKGIYWDQQKYIWQLNIFSVIHKVAWWNQAQGKKSVAAKCATN